jgi:hypothetical protein
MTFSIKSFLLLYHWSADCICVDLFLDCMLSSIIYNHLVFYVFDFWYFVGRVLLKEGWTQGLTLAKQLLYHLSYSSNPFWIGYFWDRVCFMPRLVWTAKPPICAFFVAEWLSYIITVRHWLKWGLRNFLLCWLWTMILPVSASQVIRIKGLRNHACPMILSCDFINMPWSQDSLVLWHHSSLFQSWMTIWTCWFFFCIKSNYSFRISFTIFTN